jgi:hypothetical protein
MLQRGLVAVAAVGLVLLAGCATGGGGAPTAQISTEELLATLPAEQRAPITQAENQVREAERQAQRAEEAVKLAEQRVAEAKANRDARSAEIEQAQARAELVRNQTRAQLEGAPVSGQVPTEAQAARQRVDEAEYAVEVAQWERERADALVGLREAELTYAQAFRDTARKQVDVKTKEADIVRAQVASQASPGAVPGVVDPRVAEAQAALREVQAEFAKTRADATQKLADVQLRRQAMARFESGPPTRLSGAAQTGQGQSGSPALASQPREVEAQPLPWPSAWQPEQGAGTGQTGTQGGEQTAPPPK